MQCVFSTGKATRGSNYYVGDTQQRIESVSARASQAQPKVSVYYCDPSLATQIDLRLDLDTLLVHSSSSVKIRNSWNKKQYCCN